MEKRISFWERDRFNLCKGIFIVCQEITEEDGWTDYVHQAFDVREKLFLNKPLYYNDFVGELLKKAIEVFWENCKNKSEYSENFKSKRTVLGKLKLYAEAGE